MLREKSALVVKIHKGLDIVLTVIAFVGAYFIKRHLPAPLGGLITEPSYYIVLLLIVIIWYLGFEYFVSSILIFTNRTGSRRFGRFFSR
ncbi:MAG: hypothetical protein Q8O28_10565 [Smithellaceae bacterium]|nr:hypothetical protein [Smithellaceae bacterium]